MRRTSTMATMVSGLALMLLVSCGPSRKVTETTSGTEGAANQASDPGTTGFRAARAEISNTKPDTLGHGTAEFRQKADGTVQLELEVSFPKKANSSVAVHLHEHGACGDAGKEAHGHWNPTNEPHGKWGEGSFHSGDIGNVQLDEKGNGKLTMISDRWTIGGDEKTNILNRAVIVHSGVDDYTTQPTGNAGSRIGCGVIMSR